MTIPGRLERCCNSAGVGLGGEDGDNVSPIVDGPDLSAPSLSFVVLVRSLFLCSAPIPHANPQENQPVPGDVANLSDCLCRVRVCKGGEGACGNTAGRKRRACQGNHFNPTTELILFFLGGRMLRRTTLLLSEVRIHGS